MPSNEFNNLNGEKKSVSTTNSMDVVTESEKTALQEILSSEVDSYVKYSQIKDNPLITSDDLQRLLEKATQPSSNPEVRKDWNALIKHRNILLFKECSLKYDSIKNDPQLTSDMLQPLVVKTPAPSEYVGGKEFRETIIAHRNSLITKERTAEYDVIKNNPQLTSDMLQRIIEKTLAPSDYAAGKEFRETLIDHRNSLIVKECTAEYDAIKNNPQLTSDMLQRIIEKTLAPSDYPGAGKLRETLIAHRNRLRNAA